ncbi:UvrB/UvrC motif-containing protein [Jeotgalibacillus soli]|uniref:Modulator of heat shock repressor CtsR, McsA n=1 Tax=Jeotgalibacillus soli TaxID=889306 RepID=A0A0C2RPU6_9BACL|nr:UvrB/UvrC motif-containing protein [Jeotgalibacillus soli]KIL52310.1 modulator of heat shock repressor CtsR, McsA [Jeotgalibacillus soli]
MVCQECNERPAALHFTKVINGEKTEVHLCEKCAQDKGGLFLSNDASAFSFNNLLAGLLNISPMVQQANQPQQKEHETVQCQHCHMTFHQFLKLGKFGCPNCYVTFGAQIPPILKRLHSGNALHQGKLPARIGGTIHVKRQLDELRLQLKGLIEQEEFEQAAKIRDEIRSLEKGVSDQGGENV